MQPLRRCQRLLSCSPTLTCSRLSPCQQTHEIIQHDCCKQTRRRRYGDFSLSPRLLYESRNNGIVREPAAKRRSAETRFTPSSPGSRTVLDDLRDIGINLETPLLDIDYRAILSIALHEKQSDLVLQCMLSAAKAEDLPFIREISEESFTRLLDLIKPETMISPLVKLHDMISPVQQRTLHTAPIAEIARQHAIILRSIWRLRRRARVEPTSIQYTMLLRAARDIGSYKFAHELVKSWNAVGHQMTTESWNLFMEALLGEGHLSPYRRRTFGDTRRDAVAISNKTSLVRAAEMVKNTIFPRMSDAGQVADQETYRLLLLAATKTRDLPAVVTILRSIFGIDLSSLKSFDVVQERPKARASVPTVAITDVTERTFLSIVRALMVSENVADIIRALDLITPNTALTVSPQVWEELFEYAFTLSRVSPKSMIEEERDDADDHKEGRLVLAAVRKMWKMMTGINCNERPRLRVYKYCLKTLYLARAPQAMLEILDQTIMEFRRTGAIHRSNEIDLADALRKSPRTSGIIRRKWEVSQLERSLHATWIRRSVQLYLRCTMHRPDTHGQATLRELPAALMRHQRWMPFRIKYEVAGGMIEFDLKDASAHHELAEYKSKRLKIRRAVVQGAPRLVGQYYFHRPESKGAMRNAAVQVADTS